MLLLLPLLTLLYKESDRAARAAAVIVAANATAATVCLLSNRKTEMPRLWLSPKKCLVPAMFGPYPISS